MGKLYVFGNGLDRHYGLKTSPSDFVDILRTKRIYNETGNAADIFACYNVLWSNFELDIANIDLNQIENNQVKYPDYSSDHEYDRDGVITNIEEYVNSLKTAIIQSLSEMIDLAEYDIRNLEYDHQWEFKSGDVIVSFNYTSTIETISNAYCVPIMHIHGLYRAREPLIFGYKEPFANYNYLRYSYPENGDYYMERQLRDIYDFYVSFQKPLQLEKMKNFLQYVTEIEEILVYGHSLGEVDAPYLELMDEMLNPRRWKVSYFSDNDAVLSNAEHLSFIDKIEWFRW